MRTAKITLTDRNVARSIQLEVWVEDDSCPDVFREWHRFAVDGYELLDLRLHRPRPKRWWQR